MIPADTFSPATRVLSPASLVTMLLLLFIAANLTGIIHTTLNQPIYDYSDSAYYFQRSREIAQGNWGTESIIVSHLIRHPEVEHPSFDHWQPLVPTLSGLAGRALGNPVYGATVVLLIFTTVLCPILLFCFVVSCGGSRLAGLLATAVFFSWTQLDYFRLLLETGLFSACFLLLAVLFIVVGVVRRPAPSLFLSGCAGVAFGLMACTRGDGLPVAFALTVLIPLIPPKGHRVRVAFSLLIGFALSFSPLAVRNLAVFGQLISPGMARVLSVTDFSQWAAFNMQLDPSLHDLILARYVASRRAIKACVVSPVTIACILCIGLYLLIGRMRRSWRDSLVAGKTAAILLSTLPYAFYCAAGIVLAPAVTLWFHRAPIPYLPLLLASGTLAAEHLGRHLLGGVWRWMFFVVLAATLAAGLSPNPLRFENEVSYDTTAASEAASRLRPGAVVMSNLAMALYAERGAGVVRLPDNGARAVAEAIVHYEVEFVVLFSDVPWTADFALELTRGDSLDPGGNIELIQVEETDRYTIYEVRTTGFRPAIGSGTE